MKSNFFNLNDDRSMPSGSKSSQTSKSHANSDDDMRTESGSSSGNRSSHTSRTGSRRNGSSAGTSTDSEFGGFSSFGSKRH